MEGRPELDLSDRPEPDLSDSPVKTSPVTFTCDVQNKTIASLSETGWYGVIDAVINQLGLSVRRCILLADGSRDSLPGHHGEHGRHRLLC